MNKIGEKSHDGIQLLRMIASKDEDMETAEKALHLFVGTFEGKIKKNVEILAFKNGFDENVAFEAIQCAFNKVWLYPTFDMRKSHFKDETKAIVAWLIKIALSQMYQYTNKGECARIKPEEDLSVIETGVGFVESFHISDLTTEKKMQYALMLEKKLSVLDEKHRIIYLTYKAYQTSGKKLPRKLLATLRKRLGVSQPTIRVYKKEACEAIGDLELLKA